MTHSSTIGFGFASLFGILCFLVAFITNEIEVDEIVQYNECRDTVILLSAEKTATCEPEQNMDVIEATNGRLLLLCSCGEVVVEEPSLEGIPIAVPTNGLSIL